MNFQFIDLRRSADTKHFAKIVRRQITTTVVLQSSLILPPAFQTMRAPMASRLHVTPSSFNPNQLLPLAALFLRSTGGPPLTPNDHVESTIVVVVAHCQASSRRMFLKCRTRVRTHIVQLAILALVVQQQRFFVITCME